MKKKKVFLGLAIASLGIFSMAACASNSANSSSVPAASTSEVTPTSTPTPEIKPLTINVDDVRVFYQVNDNFEKEGLKVYKTVDDELVELAATDYQLDLSGYDKTKVGNYTIKVKADGFEGEFKVFVREDDYSDYKAISNAEEFNAFRNQVSSSDKYMLTSDIDLEGVTLEATKVVFNGRFNGAGHVIKNAIYRENASNKTGILTKELTNGAVVTDVRFSNCVAELSGETIAIVTGMAYDTVTVSKVEFSNCCAICNNYAGLVIGRTNSKTAVINMSEITCKNGTYTKVTSYGGTLIGDIAAGDSATNRATVNIENCDLDIELKGANINGGFLSGRIRSNTNLNIKNVLIRSAVIEENTSGSAGLICGGGSNNGGNSTVTVENLYVASTNATTLQSCAVKNATNPVTTFQITYTNAYMASDALEDVTDKGTYLQAVDKATTDINWLKDTLLLNFGENGAWTAEANDATAYRLVNSSTNVKSPDATIKTLKLTTANATLRFEKGTEFAQGGLAVTAIYSDDVNLPLKLNAADGYEIDSSAYNKDVAGKYTITIKSKEDANVKATYQVEVVAQTGVKVDSQFAKLAYVAGEELDLKNLLVYSVWSDNKEILVDSKKYTTNAASIDTSTAGKKELSVTMTGFDPVKVNISVVDTKPVVVDNYIYINVDKTVNIAYGGQKVDGVETFTTVNDAIEYLVSAKFDDSVNKVIYVKNGTYTEKLTVPATLKNLKLIGESTANTKIEYDAVEDTINPLTGEKYVMNCATINVEATGFGLENITVSNTFDYINDNTKYGNPQGFALTINADGAVLNKVKLYGNQDTLYFRNGRVYIKDSEIDGNIDFIFGENTGIAFFDTCTIKALGKSATPQKNNGYVTAMKGDKTNHPTYGYVFSNCTFTDDGNVAEGAMSLGRPWGEGATVTYINCSFTKAYSKLAYDGSAKSRWFDMSGNNPTNAHFAEYGSTGEGAITTAVAGGSVLTEAEAANYTAANTFAKTNGGVSWSTDFDYEAEYTALNAAIAKATPASLNVASESVEVYEGGTFNLNPIIKPWNANKKDITVTNSNATAVSFENGVVTGLAAGQTATLTFTSGTLTKTVQVTVKVGTFYQVNFVTDGTAVDAQTVLDGETISAATTTLAHAKFVGWYTDENYTTKFDVTSPVTSALTLYAKFDNLLTYSYDNAGDGVRDADSVAMANSDYHTTEGGDGNTKSGDDYIKVPVIAANGYLQFNIAGYTKKVTIDLMGSTSGTNNATNIKAVAYASDGTVLNEKEFELCKSKINTRNVINLEATSNIAYVRIVNTYTKQIAILTADVTYERNVTAEKSYSITFGADGNYAQYVGDGVTVNNHASEPTSEVKGSIELNVKAGGTVVVTGYPGYYAYSIKVGDGTAVDATQECSYATVTEDTTVTITSTKYLYTIEVIYPINKTKSFAYGEGNLKTGDGLAFSYVIKKTVNDNSDSYQFKNSGYNAAVVSVAKACTVTIIGHSASYGLMEVYVNGTLSTAEISTTGTYTIEAKANDVIVVRGYAANISHSYIKGITVTYA